MFYHIVNTKNCHILGLHPDYITEFLVTLLPVLVRHAALVVRMRVLPSTTVGVVCVLLRSVVRFGNGLGVTGGGLVPGAPAAGRSGFTHPGQNTNGQACISFYLFCNESRLCGPPRENRSKVLTMHLLCPKLSQVVALLQCALIARQNYFTMSLTINIATL